MQQLHSSIFSLADSIVPNEIGVNKVHRFFDLGIGAQGEHHIMILYREAFFSSLAIGYKSPIRISKFCVAYPVNNPREVPYGHLFCVDRSRTDIELDRLIIRSLKNKNDFTVYPFEDKNLNVYKDSAGNTLIKTNGYLSCPYLVVDE